MAIESDIFGLFSVPELFTFQRDVYFMVNFEFIICRNYYLSTIGAVIMTQYLPFYFVREPSYNHELMND